jgi:hypothetical protein
MTNRFGAVVLLGFATLLTISARAQQQKSDFLSTGDFQEHKFWDRQNKITFAAHAGLAATDFALTHRNLASGGRELNPVARPFTNMGTPGEVLFFAGGTAASMGLSYMMHKTHHHSMERWVTRYAIADSASGVAYNLAQGGPAPRSATPAMGIRIQLKK